MTENPFATDNVGTRWTINKAPSSVALERIKLKPWLPSD